ncbi:ArnT family glycosyltransferase [Nocardia mikamii]|uniref:ArnT family glycosyltransferase n=1 Tax=Nocardia mikamii TaxID=508464 RepID=UPI000A06BED5|nr:glycosyltransferase family 39 protein [Nocardia mikamii]
MTETAIAPGRPADGVTTPGRGRTRSLPWEYLGLAALLGGTAIAYLWNLSANGWANSFYAAAVQSGAKSWKAFFFGSSDWGNSITVDKTPASLWPMEISARLFGMNSWSMLIPQVLIAVAAVALLRSTLRRTFGPGAGLLGGLALAVTPVATLMFRYNNPDALLVLLMIAAVWAMTRALEDGRWRWLLLCGGFVGLGFLAKQLQVLLVVPALALTYLFAGPPRLGKRLLQLLAAGTALVVGAGWWVLVAQLWPADSRPYFGGSKHDSIIELTLGYNGLQRLGVDSGGGFGGPPGPGGRGHGPSFGSEAGITRLFSETVGGQIAWLIPAALILCVAAVVLCGRAPRTDTRRAALLLWGGWAVVTALVFSFMKGIFHQYYTVALAPGVAGAAAIGAVVLWRQRDRLGVRLVLAAAIGLTTVTAVILLDRTPDFVPWLRWLIGVAGAVATVALGIPQPRRTAAWTAALAVAVAIAGPVAYSIQTIASAHNGGIVLAGPKTSGGFGFGFGPGGPGGACGPAAPGMPGANGTRPGPEVPGAPPAGAENRCVAAGSGAGQRTSTDRPSGPGMGERTNRQLIDLLKNTGAGYTWAAAAISSMGAADLQLDSGYAVMPIGGFGGGDPSPTLDRFRADVAQGRMHYFIGSERRGPGSGETSAAGRIAQWVESTYAATDVGGTKVYDLTVPTAAR